MEWIAEALLALLAALGLAAALWWVYGRLLFPARGGAPLYAVVPARGDGERLEQDLRRLLWLREGRETAVAVVIADAGLTPQGRRLAQRLLSRYRGTALCPLERLGEYLNNV